MRNLNGEYLTPSELARRWGVSEGTLRNKRSMRAGPPFVKIGRAVLYHINQVRLYEAAYNLPHEETE